MLGPFGVPELLIVLVLVLIVFGAGKLPKVMASLGRGLHEFRAELGTDPAGDENRPKAVDSR